MAGSARARPALIGRRRRRRAGSACARSLVMRPVARSTHQSLRHTAMSNSQVVDAGEVEVEHAGAACGPASNITLSRNRSACTGPRGSDCVRRRRGSVVLEVELVGQAPRERRLDVRQHDRHGLVPPGQAAQVGLVRADSRDRPGACAPASRPAAAQCAGIGASSSLLPGSLLTTAAGLPPIVCRKLPLRVGARLGHRQAVARQVLHQAAGRTAAARSPGARTPSAPSRPGRRWTK